MESKHGNMIVSVIHQPDHFDRGFPWTRRDGGISFDQGLGRSTVGNTGVGAGGDGDLRVCLLRVDQVGNLEVEAQVRFVQTRVACSLCGTGMVRQRVGRRRG